MKIEKLDHVLIQVKDLEKATKFFADLFETEFTNLGDLPEQDAKVTMDTIGIELVSPLTEDGPMAKAIEHRGEGFLALSLKVPNIKDAIAEMESRGIKLLGTRRIGRMTEAQFHPKDTFGIMLELIEYNPKHPVVTELEL